MEIIGGKPYSGKSRYMIMKVLMSDNALFLSHEADPAEFFIDDIFNVNSLKGKNIKLQYYPVKINTIHDLEKLIINNITFKNLYLDGCLEVNKIGIHKINELCEKHDKKIIVTEQLKAESEYNLLVKNA